MYQKSSNDSFLFLVKGVFSFARPLKLGYGYPLQCSPEDHDLPAFWVWDSLPVPASALCGGGVGQLSVSQQGPGCWGAEVVSSTPGTGCAGSSWGAERSGAQRDSWAGQEVGQLRQQASGPHELTARKASAGVNLASPPPRPHTPCSCRFACVLLQWFR